MEYSITPSFHGRCYNTDASHGIVYVPCPRGLGMLRPGDSFLAPALGLFALVGVVLAFLWALRGESHG